MRPAPSEDLLPGWARNRDVRTRLVEELHRQSGHVASAVDQPGRGSFGCIPVTESALPYAVRVGAEYVDDRLATH